MSDVQFYANTGPLRAALGVDGPAFEGHVYGNPLLPFFYHHHGLGYVQFVSEVPREAGGHITQVSEIPGHFDD